MMKTSSFLVLALKGLVGLHRMIQLQLLQHCWSGHSLGLPRYWKVCLGNEQRSFCHFWDCIQVLRFRLFCWTWWLSKAKTNRVLPRKCTGHSKHPLPTTQEKTLHMDITRWSTPKSDWLYSLQPKLEKLYTVRKNKTRSWLWFRSWTPYYQIQTQIEENTENR